MAKKTTQSSPVARAPAIDPDSLHKFTPNFRKNRPDECSICEQTGDAGNHEREPWHPDQVNADFIRTMPDADARRFIATLLRKAAHEMNVSGVSPARSLEIVAEEIEAFDAMEKPPDAVPTV